MQKCAGCPWIGWIHDVHLAETIDLALVAEKWFAQANQTQTKIDLEGENHEG